MKIKSHLGIGVFGIIVLFVTVFSNPVFSQVKGISASKVGTYCIGTVPKRDLEFKPSFSFGISRQKWNSNYKLENSFATPDSLETYSEYSLRFTYGLTDKIEIGLSAPSDISGVSFGIKYIAMQNDKSGISIISGINSPLGNRFYDLSSKDSNDMVSFAVGFVYSHKINDKLLFDFDIQGQTLMKNAKENHHYDLFINSDLGYYANEHTQLICGLSYYNDFYNDSKLNNSLLDIHPGISYETGENFLIVISSPIGLYGKNEKQNYGINIAFTMTIR
jgi:hypothetical protein